MSMENSESSPTFESSLAALQKIVQDLEAGTLGLEESLGRFQAGMGLLQHCYGLLETAERQIELLTGFSADGTPLTEPFDATATLQTAAPEVGRRRRTSAVKNPNEE